MQRLFIAVPLSDEVRAALTRHLAGRELPGRPVPAANWHLTLRFLGDSDEDRRRAVEAALGRTGLGQPFEISFGALGAFPRPSRASVVWIAVHDRSGEMQRLAAAAEAASREAGYPPEERSFMPHLTIARHRTPRDVALPLQRCSPAGVRMDVDEVHLMASHMGAGPPRYETLTTWPLR